MPLIRGKSPKSFSKNVETEMHEGKPQGQSLAIAYAMKKKAKKMARGGPVERPFLEHEEPSTVHYSRDNEKGKGRSMAGDMYRAGHKEEAKEMHRERLEDLGIDKKQNRKYLAEGGMVDHEDNDDIVGNIMRCRYSKGGMVANDTPDTADFEDNDFDDLALDDGLEEHYTGANSGDELGDEEEDEERRDMVAQIMKSRKLKEKMPRPA